VNRDVNLWLITQADFNTWSGSVSTLPITMASLAYMEKAHAAPCRCQWSIFLCAPPRRSQHFKAFLNSFANRQKVIFYRWSDHLAFSMYEHRDPGSLRDGSFIAWFFFIRECLLETSQSLHLNILYFSVSLSFSAGIWHFKSVLILNRFKILLLKVIS